MDITDYWYEHRDELSPGDIVRLYDGSMAKLDHRVPGDGTRWYVATWYPISFTIEGKIHSHGGWLYEDSQIEPGDIFENYK